MHYVNSVEFESSSYLFDKITESEQTEESILIPAGGECFLNVNSFLVLEAKSTFLKTSYHFNLLATLAGEETISKRYGATLPTLPPMTLHDCSSLIINSSGNIIAASRDESGYCPVL